MQSEQTTPCSNCGAFIPDSKVMLHELYCERNCKKCPTCGRFYDLNDVESHQEEYHKKPPAQPLKKQEIPQQQNKKEDLSAIQKKINQIHIEEEKPQAPEKKTVPQKNLPSRNDYSIGSQNYQQTPITGSQIQNNQRVPQTNIYPTTTKQKDEVIMKKYQHNKSYNEPYDKSSTYKQYQAYRNEPPRQFQEAPKPSYDIPKSYENQTKIYDNPKSYEPQKDSYKQSQYYKINEKDQDRQPPSRTVKQEEYRKPDSRQAQDRNLPRNDDLRKQPSFENKNYGKNETIDMKYKQEVNNNQGNKYQSSRNQDKPTSNYQNIPQTQLKKEPSNKPVSKRPDTAIAREIQAQMNLEPEEAPKAQDLGMTEDEYQQYLAYEQSMQSYKQAPKMDYKPPIQPGLKAQKSYNYGEDDDEQLQRAIQESMKLKK